MEYVRANIYVDTSDREQWAVVVEGGIEARIPFRVTGGSMDEMTQNDALSNAAIGIYEGVDWDENGLELTSHLPGRDNDYVIRTEGVGEELRFDRRERFHRTEIGRGSSLTKEEVIYLEAFLKGRLGIE